MTNLSSISEETMDELEDLANDIQDICEKYNLKCYIHVYNPNNDNNYTIGNACYVCIKESLEYFIRENGIKHLKDDKGK